MRRTARSARVLRYPMPAVTSSGVGGRPSAATELRRADLLDQLVAALDELLAQARAEQDPVF
jgi:hypothetical protein